jgi:hypothetical protein
VRAGADSQSAKADLVPFQRRVSNPPTANPPIPNPPTADDQPRSRYRSRSQLVTTASYVACSTRAALA